MTRIIFTNLDENIIDRANYDNLISITNNKKKIKYPV